MAPDPCHVFQLWKEQEVHTSVSSFQPPQGNACMGVLGLLRERERERERERSRGRSTQFRTLKRTTRVERNRMAKSQNCLGVLVLDLHFYQKHTQPRYTSNLSFTSCLRFFFCLWDLGSLVSHALLNTSQDLWNPRL